MVFKEQNEYLEIDWSHTHLSGASFGGGLALDMAVTAIPSYRNLPPNLAIKLHVRYGLIQLYSKEAGEYMEVSVSREEAEAYSREMRALRDRGVLLVPQAARDPPDGMYAAYCSSVSKDENAAWGSYWRTETIWERLGRSSIHLSYMLAVRLDHGCALRRYDCFGSDAESKVPRGQGCNLPT
jgi:hypothetical protein